MPTHIHHRYYTNQYVDGDYQHLDDKMGQEEFLNTIKAKKKDLTNSTEFSHYKSANTDVIGVLMKKLVVKN